MRPFAKNQCSGNIINAHSLSKMATLGNIAENHHVTSYGKNINNLFFKDKFQFDKISMRSASTFTGFCGTHDRDLFERLDKHDFDGSPDQTTILALRTTCREIYAKENAVSLFQNFGNLDAGQDIARQAILQQLRAAMHQGNAAGLKDLSVYKKEFEKITISIDPGRVRYINLSFKTQPILASTGVFTSTQDINLQKIQYLGNINKQSELMAFSVLPMPAETVISIAWLDGLDGSVKSLLSSLFSHDFNFGTMVWLVLVYIENTFFRTSFIKSLKTKDRILVEHAAHFGMSHEEIPTTIDARKMLEYQLAFPGKLLSSKIF